MGASVGWGKGGVRREAATKRKIKGKPEAHTSPSPCPRTGEALNGVVANLDNGAGKDGDGRVDNAAARRLLLALAVTARAVAGVT